MSASAISTTEPFGEAPIPQWPPNAELLAAGERYHQLLAANPYAMSWYKAVQPAEVVDGDDDENDNDHNNKSTTNKTKNNKNPPEFVFVTPWNQKTKEELFKDLAMDDEVVVDQQQQQQHQQQQSNRNNNIIAAKEGEEAVGGLLESYVNARRQVFGGCGNGDNNHHPSASFANTILCVLKIFLMNVVSSARIVVYLLAVVIFGYFQDWANFGVTFGVIVVAGLIGAYQQWVAASQLEDRIYEQILNRQCTVKRRRSGSGSEEERIIRVSELVVGDIVRIDEKFPIVPCDGRILSIVGGEKPLCIDQTRIYLHLPAGERRTFSVHHKCIEPEGEGQNSVLNCRNMVFAGTHLLSGAAYCLVISVGSHTLLHAMREKNYLVVPPWKNKLQTFRTNIQMHMEYFSYLSFAIILLLVFVVIFGVHHYGLKEANLKYGLSLALAAYPFAQFAVSCVALAVAVEDLAEKNIIVRDPNKIDQLDLVTDVCLYPKNVPVDSSLCSGVDLLSQLCRRMGIELHVLPVYNPFSSSTDGVGVSSTPSDLARRSMKEIVDLIHAEGRVCLFVTGDTKICYINEGPSSSSGMKENKKKEEEKGKGQAECHHQECHVQLTQSDIVLALGCGTDRAKDDADFFISTTSAATNDDGMGLVLLTLLQGRFLVRRIVNVVMFTFSLALAGCVVLIFGLGIAPEVDSEHRTNYFFPLNPMHGLWLNVFVGTPLAIGLALDRAAPRRKESSSSSSNTHPWLSDSPNYRSSSKMEMIVDIFCYGGFLGGLALCVFSFVVYGMHGGNGGSPAQDCNIVVNNNQNSNNQRLCEPIWRARSATFIFLYFGCILHAFLLRFFRGENHRWYVGTFVSALVVVPVSVYVEPVAKNMFLQHAIDLEWLVCVVALIIFVAGVELYKMVKKKLLR